MELKVELGDVAGIIRWPDIFALHRGCETTTFHQLTPITIEIHSVMEQMNHKFAFFRRLLHLKRLKYRNMSKVLLAIAVLSKGIDE